MLPQCMKVRQRAVLVLQGSSYRLYVRRVLACRRLLCSPTAWQTQPNASLGRRLPATVMTRWTACPR